MRTAEGEEELSFDREDLYARSLRQFHAAIRGKGQPSATGEDGVWSLAISRGGAAVREVRQGRRDRSEARERHVSKVISAAAGSRA